MYCCSAQESQMDYKRRFLLGGSKQKVPQYPMPGAPAPPASGLAAVADIQQGVSRYLDALNVFCRASAFLADLFGGVFRNGRFSRAAAQLRDVQDRVTEAAGRLTAAIKPEIARMLMELSAGATNFKDQSDLSVQDIEVLGRCFLTVMQVHFQFLSQALQKVQPVVQSCLVEAVSQAQDRRGNSAELDEATRSWKAAAEATSPLRERGRDGALAGIEVQQLFCSHDAAIPEHQLRELNMKIDRTLQAYKVALESLGHSEYALKAGFHLSPKSVEASLQDCCSEAETQLAGRRHNPSQPIQFELSTIPLHIGSHFLKGANFNESAADNLKLKMHTTLQLIKEVAGQNGAGPRDDSPATEVLNLVCPSSWRGACKTAAQLLFGQAGLVVVDSAQTDSKETYAPYITAEGSQIVVQVPSTWCLKEDPATMSLLQRSLDPEKTLGLVDILYTATFDLNRWKERREQALPTIQVHLQRECSEFGVHRNGPKSSSGLPKTISKLTSKFTKRTSSSGGSSSPCRSISAAAGPEDKAKQQTGVLRAGSSPCTPARKQSLQEARSRQLANGCAPDDKGTNLPTDREMQDVIDFLSGFNMGKSQQASPLVKRRNSVASASAAELKPPSGAPQPPAPVLQQQQQPSPQALQYYQRLLQPAGQQSQASPQLPSQQQQRASSKWLGSSTQQALSSGLSQIGHVGQWAAPTPGLPDISSDLYSLGLASTYMDGGVSEVLGQKTHTQRNNTWPNRVQGEGAFDAPGDALPFHPAVGSDPEFARYVAGVSQAMQQKRNAQHVRLPSNGRSNWSIADEPHRSWPHPEYYTDGDAMGSSWLANQGDSASSSDETSSTNGDSLFSMFSGPDLVAAVNQRRKHSCGEQEVCTLSSPPLHHPGEDSCQESKLKTWPPKAPWQHSSSSSAHSGTLPNPSSSLYQMTLPSSQWGDSMQMLQSTVWSSAGDCSASAGLSSGFPYTQQQASQHKPIHKPLKSLPLKPEHRPPYLPQY